MKKTIFVGLALAVAAGGYLSYTAVGSHTSAAIAAKKTYSSTMYVAGMGGHFAVADVTIDPNDTENPIKVNSLDKMDIGTGKTHPTHDPRVDVNDPNTMYWSTYKYDPQGNLHVGKTDLKTGKVIKDTAVPRPSRVDKDVANYCGSGQSQKYYFPVSMSNEGYIDVVDKATMEVKQHVFFDDLGIKSGEITFAHGINTPDMKNFLLTVNLTPEGFTKFTGNTKLIMLDMAALEQGKLQKVAEATITGKPKDATGGTITFRQFFSKDGSLLFQSGADRGYMIDAKTLKVLDEITDLPGENHDLMPTPDGKYAVMTLRQKIQAPDGKEGVDGTLLLYDVEAKATVGKTASVCYTCHKDQGATASAVLCGIDANWK